YADNPTFLENTATVKPGNGVLTNQSTTVVLVEGNNCVQNEPLAVEFLDFDAAAAGQTIVLNWETADESNAEEFVIERRTKSDVLFRRIGNVEAQNEAFNRYQFVDENVRGGVEYFYRLRQVDSDAKTIFSPIRQASIAGKGEYEVTLVPNPTTGAVTLNWTKDLPNNYEVEVIAANGQIIQTQQVTNGDAPRLDLSSFPTNLYFVKINTERGSIVKKLMLNK
ncbi:MAG: T9SS type A sorting domain-containing protein, partial [Bacteroidota bacterium]